MCKHHCICVGKIKSSWQLMCSLWSGNSCNMLRRLNHTFSNRYPMTRKPFPPSICSCMATELLSSSTRKARRVALQKQQHTPSHTGIKPIPTLITCWRRYARNYSSMRRQCGRGKKNKDVSNQLGAQAHHFHLSSVQKRRLTHWALRGKRVVSGWAVTGCVCICMEWVGEFKGARYCTEGNFFFVAGFFSWQWRSVTLLNRLCLTSSAGLCCSATIAMTQSLLCRLAHRYFTYTQNKSTKC